MNIKLGVSLLLLMRSGFVVFGASLCLLGDFDSQAKYLLNNEMLSPQELREIALNFDELRETLRARWGDADLFVYGSLPAGLGTKTSDVDVYLRVPGFNNKTQTQIYEDTLKVLRQQSKKFDHIVPKPEKAIPRITYFDNSMQRSVDLSFAVSIAMANTKVMKYYFNLDNRSLPLAAIIKFWCKVHELTGKGLLPNYSVYLMIAFYLEHKNMVPSVYQIQANLPPRYADKWNVNFEETPYNVANHETLYELLGGFFKFYSDFNFAKYCVSPFMGRPLAKSNFKDVSNVPEEFSLYVENVNKGYYHPLPIESEICVQDIFNHSGNTAQRVDKAGALKFINHVKLASKYYDNLPSDKFLRSILTRNKHKKTYTLGKHLEVITILKRKDCLTEKRV